MFRDEKYVYAHESRKSLFGYSDKKYARLPKGNDTLNRLKEDLHAAKQRLRFHEYRLKNCDDESRISYYKENAKKAKDDIERLSRLLENQKDVFPCHKLLKRKIKKRTNKQIKEEILKIIEEARKANEDSLTKEDVAIYLQVKEKQVEQVFMELNREGILSQPVHRAPHDSSRDPHGFECNNWWVSDRYYIRNPKQA